MERSDVGCWNRGASGTARGVGRARAVTGARGPARARWWGGVLLVAAVAAAVAGLRMPAAAQQALVLGGGGSRGLAHAGVLVGLDSLGYSPELVVGTSMGAIIGALYAAGHEPDAIWRLVLETDWQELFTPMPAAFGPDRRLVYPLFGFPLDDGPGARPRGLVPDWRVNRLLERTLLDAGVRSRGDFDRLPRRYRAVTADLANGKAVVLGRGDLARAVRASMAVPGVFAPVLWDGRVLVDGGIADNLPVAEAAELGGRPIVAVDVVRPDAGVPEIGSLSLAIRAFRLVLENARPDTIQPDVLILPDLGPGLSEALFPRDPEWLLETGLAAVAGVPPAGPGQTPARAPLPAPARLGAPVVDADDPGLTPLVRAAFGRELPGPYDPEGLLRAADRLYATGLFEGIWLHVPPRGGGADGGATGGDAEPVVVRAEATPRLSLTGAPGYDTDRGGRVWAMLAGRAGAGATPVELSLAGHMDGLGGGGTAAARVVPAALLPFSVSAGAHFVETDRRIFDRGGVRGEVEVRRAGGFLGVERLWIGPDRWLVAQIRAESVRQEGGLSGASVGPALRWERADRLTRIVGESPLVEAEARFGEVDYRRARVRGGAVWRPGCWYLALAGDLAAVSDGAPADAVPALGDERLVPGMRWGEEPGRTRIVAGGDVAYPIPLDGVVRLRIRSGAAVGDADRLRDGGAWVTGAELGLLWATPFGRIEAAFGANTRGRRRVEVVGGNP